MGEITKLEFCERFVAEMMTYASVYEGSPADLLAYADAVAPICWEERDQRSEGPEECAQAEWVRAETIPHPQTHPSTRSRSMTAETYNCPICVEPINEGDMCLRDIDEGDCHARCLEGAPFVDLDTGDLLPDFAPKPEPYPWRGE